MAYCQVSDPAGIDSQENGRGKAEGENSAAIYVWRFFSTSEIKGFIIINQSEWNSCQLSSTEHHDFGTCLAERF